MSSVTAVVLHPTVSHTLKVWSTTIGRDKVNCLVLRHFCVHSLRCPVLRLTVLSNILHVSLPGSCFAVAKVIKILLLDGARLNPALLLVEKVMHQLLFNNSQDGLLTLLSNFGLKPTYGTAK
jgi:hypothetical protein